MKRKLPQQQPLQEQPPTKRTRTGLERITYNMLLEQQIDYDRLRSRVWYWQSRMRCLDEMIYGYKQAITDQTTRYNAILQRTEEKGKQLLGTQEEVESVSTHLTWLQRQSIEARAASLTTAECIASVRQLVEDRDQLLSEHQETMAACSAKEVEVFQLVNRYNDLEAATRQQQALVPLHLQLQTNSRFLTALQEEMSKT